jgi:hypothetical protein
MMREIREEISREIQGMSFEQERECIEKHLKSRREDEKIGERKGPRTNGTGGFAPWK